MKKGKEKKEPSFFSESLHDTTCQLMLDVVYIIISGQGWELLKNGKNHCTCLSDECGINVQSLYLN